MRRELERVGYHIFEVRRRGGLGWLGLGSFSTGPRRINPRKLVIFNQELSALLRAGLPLLQALELVLERQKDEVFRATLTEIRDRVESGESLSEAVAAQGEIFPPPRRSRAAPSSSWSWPSSASRRRRTRPPPTSTSGGRPSRPC